ncbi:DUF3040 domain-containing protein [Arthrobacter antioxidans]|uniref:DUF3040 domain-containing protein n=1 Tax=Arthrobacter antioxidans TaxID=2895818 RepID=UPI001FFF2639|nr:DUF3040 domain-containing protein [Arthrobacter antioxidans]
MPLSEEERLQLEALERSLMAEDPALARTFHQGRGSAHLSVRTVLPAVVAVVAAFAVVMAGVIGHLPVLGILGFILMIVGGAMTGPSHQLSVRSMRQPRTSEGVL